MLLTVDQVAERLNVSTDTVYRLVARKAICHVRIGGRIRIDEESVDHFICRQTVPAQISAITKQPTRGEWRREWDQLFNRPMPSRNRGKRE